MCGRYYIEDDTFEIQQILSELDQRHSVSVGEIFPTNIAPIISRDGVAAVKWDFPQWKGNGVIINARVETALEKSTFRRAMLESRCVIPCSGFFEWKQIEGSRKKDKYFLTRPGGGVLYLAGACSKFRDTSGEYEAFVILTTAANESVAEIHDRMPVILGVDERDAWLGDLSFSEHVLKRAGPELELELADGT